MQSFCNVASVVSGFKQINSTFGLYNDWFITDYDNFAMSCSFSKIQGWVKTNT